MSTALRLTRATGRHGESRHSRRRRRWWSGWRSALRLARRDVGRHRGASLLILAMVGLPVFLISGASAALATTDLTPVESLPAVLGSAQAAVGVADRVPIVQSLDGSAWVTDPARPSEPEAGPALTPDQIGALAGGRVAAIAYPPVFGQIGDRVVRGHALAVDDPGTSGLATVVEGRLPQGPAEIAITEAGVDQGWPRTGPVTVRDEAGMARAARVTGVVTAVDRTFEPVSVVLDGSWVGDDDRSYLLFTDRPVSWSDVRALNSHGLAVVSREVLTHPDGIEIDPSVQGGRSSPLEAGLIGLICVGLVLETTLMAGPAFAVSAARRRRTLALIGSNGADRSQLRRFVLAQGVVLGALAAVVGAVSGTLAGWGAVRLYDRFGGGTIGHPPYDFYASITLLVLVTAVLASVIAAAIPARGAARLAVAGSLTGNEQRTRSARVPELIGLVSMALGIALLAVAATGLHAMTQLVATGTAAGLMIIGASLANGLIISGVARLLAHGPPAVRMAARDTARSGSRAASAIAAVTMAVAVLTIIAVANASDDAANRRDYTPRVAYGHGTVDSGFGGGLGEATVTEIRRQHPDWLIHPNAELGTFSYSTSGSATGSLVAAVPPGCSVTAATRTDEVDISGDPCRRLGTAGQTGTMLVRDLDQLPVGADLSAAQLDVLRDGGVLVTDPAVLRGDRLRLVSAAVAEDGSEVVGRPVELPAATLTPMQLNAAQRGEPGYAAEGLLMASATAAAAELPLTVSRYEVVDPTGPISKSDERAVNARSVSALDVERGYTSPIRTIVTVLLVVAALLVAVAALISTALAQVEGRADLATMAAIGASRGFRRRLAAAQAVVVGLTGALLGVVLGLGPGIVFGISFTSESSWSNPSITVSQSPTLLVVPWSGLAVLVLGVPLATGLLAALSARSRPTLTRRLD